MASESQPELVGILSIIDRATAPLRQIAQQLHMVGHAAHEAGEETEHLHHEEMWEGLHENVELLGEHFGELRASIGETNESMAELLPMLGAFGEAAAVVGLVEMVHKVADTRSQLIATAAAIGITAEQLETFNYIATMANVPIDTMHAALGKLQNTVGGALTGKGKLAIAMFQHMHVALRDSHGAARSLGDIVPEVSEALNNTRSPAMAVFAATTLFGKAGREMLPMLRQSKEALHELGEQAERINFHFKEEDDSNLVKFRQSWEQLSGAVEGFESEVGSALAPVFGKILDGLREWVLVNRHWLAGQITYDVGKLVGYGRELIDALKKIDWRGAARGAQEWGHALGGVHTALVAMVILLGSPLLIGFVSLMHAVEHLGRGLVAIGRIALAVAGALGGPLVAAVSDIATGLMATLGVFETIGLVFASNPLGVVLLAIALLVVAGYELWQHWSAVKGFFVRMWADLVAMWQHNTGYLRSITEILLLPAEEIKLHWTPIKAFFADLWTGIADAFRSGWAYVSGIVDDLKKAVSWFGSSWVGRGLGAAGAFLAHGAVAQVSDTVQSAQAVASIVRQNVAPAAAGLDAIYGYVPPPGGSSAARPVMVPVPAGLAGVEAPASLPLGPSMAGTPIPSPYGAERAGSALPAPAAASVGKSEITVRFENLPPGTAVTTRTDGLVEAPKVELGQNYPAGRDIGR